MREATSNSQPDCFEINWFRLIILPFSQRNARKWSDVASEVPTTCSRALMSSAVLGASSSPNVPRSLIEPFLQRTACLVELASSHDPVITPALLIAWALQS